MTKAAVLDTSLQRTHEWLRDIADELGFDNERAATELAAHCGAELPMLVRGIHYDGRHLSADRLKAAHDSEFRDSMHRELQAHDE
jgi:uncharacterized protein (DUF2267 family)